LVGYLPKIENFPSLKNFDFQTADFFVKTKIICTQEKSSDFFPPSSTCEELIESAEEGRKRIAAGNYIEIDDLLRELDEDFKEDIQNESESSTVDKRELAEI
jgi:hypothetical protein